MLDIISISIFLIIVVIFFIYLYIKLKFGFWSIQPVFHIYDLQYYINYPGILNINLPEKNKYTNFNNIDTFLFGKLSSYHLQKFLHLIRLHYLQNKDNIYYPKKENIFPYLSCHNSKTFVSLYLEDYFLLNEKSQNTIQDKKIIGAITSRPINILINNKNKEANFNAYYVDYLCVDKNYRKKGIAAQLIQTHHYNQRYLNKNISISLFKREEELTGIVPMCCYNTYGFPVNKWNKPPDLIAPLYILEINEQNFIFLHNFLKENTLKFDIIITTEITNIIELIKTKNIYIYILMENNIILSVYFYRKTCVQIEKGIEILSCFASICNTNENIFIHGFKISFWKIAAENMFGFAAIEEISDNDIIINNIKKKTKPSIISPTAYFFYNFAYPTFSSKKVFIIN